MKVAMPVFKNRISPVIDWCRDLVIFEVNSGQRENIETIPVAHLSPFERVDLLVTNGITLLVCGAISQPLLAITKSRGIRVMSGVSGQINEIADAIISGRLDIKHFAMPGCGRARRGRGCGHDGHGRGAHRR